MRNHLTMLNPSAKPFGGAEGLVGPVVVDATRRGQFGSNGAASTYCTVDPQKHLVAILMPQHLPRISRNFHELVYQALQ
jgi:CubicO group peptidase (beta-lactamase class C family)